MSCLAFKNFKEHKTRERQSIFFLFLQAQRSTLEHTKVSEEPAKGVQV